MRALMILRNYKGRVKSVGKQQVKSGFILDAVKKISGEFPILKEARREVLEDVMDIANAKKIIELVKEGKIKIKFVQTSIPSPFSLNLIMQGRMDLLKMEDKIEFLKRVYKALKEREK
jgi:ATP-dependent Lhr-like helicase